MTTPGRVVPMSVPECRERLGAGTIGRVAWNTVDGPLVVPVTYRLHGQSVVFRTVVDGILAALARPRRVAFEIDEYDLATRSGWSVLVTGRSQGVQRPEELIRLWAEADPEPWAAGRRNQFIAVSLDQLSGRTVQP